MNDVNERNNDRGTMPLHRLGVADFSRAVLLSILTLAPVIPHTAGANGRDEGVSERAQVGKASWYGPGFHGRRTASGEVFNANRLTAAHPRLPLGTRARVTNLQNGRVVEVKINDRGPHGGGRIIDLSRAAARQLAMGGTARVSIVALGPDLNEE